MHGYIRILTYTYIHTRMHAYTHILMGTCMYEEMMSHVSIYTHIYIHIYSMHTGTRIRAYPYFQTYVTLNTYTYMHTLCMTRMHSQVPEIKAQHLAAWRRQAERERVSAILSLLSTLIPATYIYIHIYEYTYMHT